MDNITEDIRVKTAEFLRSKDAPKEVFDYIYSIQKDHMDKWRDVLNDTAYNMLEKFVAEEDKNVVRPDDIVRGNVLSNFIANISYYKLHNQYM